MPLDHLTIKEAAAELRCSKAHVYNLINGIVAGVPALPAVRLGRRKLIRRPSLVAWTAAVETTGGNRPGLPEARKASIKEDAA